MICTCNVDNRAMVMPINYPPPAEVPSDLTWFRQIILATALENYFLHTLKSVAATLSFRHAAFCGGYTLVAVGFRIRAL